jgi:hypothetical protein
MTNEQKRQVREALIRYMGNFSSQSEAAESLQGISASTISQVKNNNWELLSDRLWHTIARQVGFYSAANGYPDGYPEQPADTSAYLLLRILFSDAQHYAMAYGIAISTGLGKTFAAGHYTHENDNTLCITGHENYNRKSFLIALMQSAGIEAKGSVPQMMEQFTAHISGLEEPLLILDDAHKLKDRVLHMVVLLANALTGKVGIIVMGNTELRIRIVEGVRLKKVGFDEIYKSIGRRFITLSCLGPKDVELVCQANGVYDEDIINHITGACDNDLHTAVQLIHQSQLNIAA